MKPWMVNKLLRLVALGSFFFPVSVTYAAQQEVMWGNVGDYNTSLKNFTLIETAPIPKDLRLPTHLAIQQNSANTLQFLSGQVDYAHQSHARYNQYYQGIPVWLSQVIYHVTTSGKTSVTGSLIKGIEQDITDLNGKISIEQAKQIAIGKNSVRTQVNIEKIIYFDQDVSNKALLAYHISYLTHTVDGPAIPSYIIDATSGKILNEWDALPRAEIGQGSGGVSVDGRLKYRHGNFQYGNSVPDVNSLGLLDVEYSQNTCTISNNLFNVVNLQNKTEHQLPFGLPASSADEKRYNIKSFSYSCSAPNYSNLTDGGYSPVNDGLSPINDVTYFIKQTFDMLINQYKVASPVGTKLPVRIYTHVNNLDNAFACGPTCLKESRVVGPQQITYGNGNAKNDSPLTDGDGISHEFGHLVTEHFSDLNYENQSGGMNEAFSDITGMAMNDYMRTTLGYTWYWDGKDWTTGASISKTGTPMRYFDNPHADNKSIDKLSEYRAGMDTHLSSGVYNKAFYLLSTSWTVAKAYQVFLDANMNYWTPRSTFKSGGCGVLQAARGRGYPEQDVKNAFQQVGISLDNCKKT